MAALIRSVVTPTKKCVLVGLRAVISRLLMRLKKKEQFYHRQDTWEGGPAASSLAMYRQRHHTMKKPMRGPMLCGGVAYALNAFVDDVSATLYVRNERMNKRDGDNAY